MVTLIATICLSAGVEVKGGIQRIIVTMVLIVVIVTASLVMFSNWGQTEDIPSIQANKGETIQYPGTGPANSDVVLCFESTKSITPSNNQYSYTINNLHVPSLSDKFILEAYSVKNLIVTGSVLGLSGSEENQADANNNCGFSLRPADLNIAAQLAIQSGLCSVTVSGEPASADTNVILKVKIERTIHIGSNGEYTMPIEIPNMDDAVGIYYLYQNDVLVAEVYVGVPTPSPTPAPLSRYTYDLRPGWNLISIPLVLQNNGISSIFPADVKSKIVTIWGWDEATQNWRYFSEQDNYFYEYFPGLTNLETGKAYWVEISEPATVEIQGTIPGSAPNSPVAYGSPWSLIGPTGLSSSTPESMYPNSISVWGWDQTRQNWVYYSTVDNYFYEYFHGIGSIQPGYGYWVER